ncbi:MAG: bifunctional precorrin-2 dehydrogenase/sirohydrochlorin ferrochelatase [Syntrophobacterales bacterium]|nr:bifunctional precorrin-2 dehydrogenase/sirohydrochlorin ferrochelatase [Syntrophobacterales bacterium]
MKYYPVFLDIAGRPCAVVGGGEVALRKTQRLLQCHARVLVIAEKLTAPWQDLPGKDGLRFICKAYDPRHIEGMFLVIGATNREDVNERVFQDARKRQILVNIVDDPGRCDFILPSLVERGDLSVAISTGGKSPAMAKRLRQELENTLGAEYETALEIMGDIRRIVRERSQPSHDNQKIFAQLIYSDMLRLIREKDWDTLRKLITNIVPEAENIRLPS